MSSVCPQKPVHKLQRTSSNVSANWITNVSMECMRHYLNVCWLGQSLSEIRICFFFFQPLYANMRPLRARSLVPKALIFVFNYSQ